MSTHERLALRRLWHRMFDPCPELRHFLGERHAEVFEAFLSYANRHHLALDWSFHCDLMVFMEEREKVLNPEIIEELLTASAINWTGQSLSLDRAVVLTSSFMPRMAVWVRKPSHPLLGPEADLIEWPHASVEPVTSYFQPHMDQIIMERSRIWRRL